jgi:outer membrane protein assembly factor BamD
LRCNYHDPILLQSKSLKDEDTLTPANQLYGRGVDLLESGKYSEAAKEFGEVFLQHPGSLETPQAELMQAYSLYLGTKYDEALDVLETFLKLHPANIYVPYAYYLRALSYYKQIPQSYLDQSVTLEAKEALWSLHTYSLIQNMRRMLN